MAEFQNLETYTLEAAADLSAKQYHIVRGSAISKCNMGSAATDSGLIGVLQNKPQSGEFACIADGGISKIVAGGTVTANQLVTTNGSGRAANAGSGDMIVGRALDTATTNGEIISVRLLTPVRLSGAA